MWRQVACLRELADVTQRGMGSGRTIGFDERLPQAFSQISRAECRQHLDSAQPEKVVQFPDPRGLLPVGVADSGKRSLT